MQEAPTLPRARSCDVSKFIERLLRKFILIYIQIRFLCISPHIIRRGADSDTYTADFVVVFRICPKLGKNFERARTK